MAVVALAALLRLCHGAASSVVLEPREVDLGLLMPGAAVQQTFRLRNTAARPLTIAEVSASCGCTSPRVSSRLLPGGGECRVTVELNTTGLRPPRDVLERVTLTLRRGNAEYRERLTLRAQVRPLVELEPALLRIRQTPSSRQCQGSLTVRRGSLPAAAFRSLTVESPSCYRVTTRRPNGDQILLSLHATRGGLAAHPPPLTLRPVNSSSGLEVCVPVEWDQVETARLTPAAMIFDFSRGAQLASTMPQRVRAESTSGAPLKVLAVRPVEPAAETAFRWRIRDADESLIEFHATSAPPPGRVTTVSFAIEYQKKHGDDSGVLLLPVYAVGGSSPRLPERAGQ